MIAHDLSGRSDSLNRNRLRNGEFEMLLSERGTVKSLKLRSDSKDMNWVIDQQYLHAANYLADDDKLFGEWEALVDGVTIKSMDIAPTIVMEDDKVVSITYHHQLIEIIVSYDLTSDPKLQWNIVIRNLSSKSIKISGFHMWFSLAYVMFRDTNVLRNIHQSTALFPHLAGEFSKFACIRRSNEAPHLAIYTIKGKVAALGSYCRYSNKFLEQVSPSLDGMLFHRLSLVESGQSMEDLVAVDWLYDEQYYSMELASGQASEWSFVFSTIEHQYDFYNQALVYDHPKWKYDSVIVRGGVFSLYVEVPKNCKIEGLQLFQLQPTDENFQDYTMSEQDLTGSLQREQGTNHYRLSLKMSTSGECKLVFLLDNGQSDTIIFNVLEPIADILEQRAKWLCENNYNPNALCERPYSFLPSSNQGESLGKLSFILMKNRLAKPNLDQIHKVELSAVYDIKNHWFKNGDFQSPRALYGSFYRIYDFDYIAHVYYLLGCMENSNLRYEASDTYLQWAAEILCFRLDPHVHKSKREQEEAQLVGVFVWYIADLLDELQQRSITSHYERLKQLWDSFVERLAHHAKDYAGAITEHFYDNAGFAPMSQALCMAGQFDDAEKYSELIIANIGFSNDYRAYAADRWWEALSYMTHSLWGGLVAGAARVVYESLQDVRLLQLSYNATMALFNCYDWNVRSTVKILQPGEAASTYSIAAPNLNMPYLSRNRFGQSIFKRLDDPLFDELFSSLEGDDWDMGEELVSYLLGFGTTTYLYHDEHGELNCINGSIEQQENGYKIISYAAYPTTYKYLQKGFKFQAEQGQLYPSIMLTESGFRKD